MSEATNEGEQHPTETLTADNPDAQALLTAEQGGDMPHVSEEPLADPRPWHGAENPFEALWQHFTAEIAKLKGAREA